MTDSSKDIPIVPDSRPASGGVDSLRSENGNGKQNDRSLSMLSAPEIATFVVCPEAFRLKRTGFQQRLPSETSHQAHKLRAAWVATHELSARLRRYTLYVYALVVMIVLMIFANDHHLITKMKGAARAVSGGKLGTPLPREKLAIDPVVPTELLIIILLLGALIFVWDLLDRRSKKLQLKTGLAPKTEVIALRGSTQLPPRELRSEELGLTARPYGLIRDGTAVVPVEHFPTAKKIQDRHVVQILAALRLLRETEKVTSDYGLLVMGSDQRSVKLRDTDKKQAWLDSLMSEMRAILNGKPAQPAPSFYKCRSCDVRGICEHSAFRDKVGDDSSVNEPNELES